MLRFKTFLMLAVLGGFLAGAQQASAAVALVQKAKGTAVSSTDGVSVSASLPNPPASGNLLVAIVAGVNAITQPAGWSTAINQPSQAIFYKISAGGAADQTLSRAGSHAIQLFEYSGVAAVNPLEAVGSASGSTDFDGNAGNGFTASSGSVVPTTFPALLIAGFFGSPQGARPLVNAGTGNGSFSAYTNGFTEQENMSAPDVPCDESDPGCYGFAGVDRVTAAFGTFSTNATFTNQRDGNGTIGSWRGQIVAFKPAAPTAAPSTVTGRVLDTDGNPVAGAAIRLTGSQNRLTITDTAGNYRFDNVDADGIYTVRPSRANYNFSPMQRSFSQVGVNTDAAFVGSYTGGAANPMANSAYFVRQQYLDFLGREPDEAGFNFWVNNIEMCGADAECRAIKTVDTSAAFFLSIEFQQTGYLVYRMYQTAYGDMSDAPVPLRLGEFKPDSKTISDGVIVNAIGWQDKLETNKTAFAEEFVQRARFAQAYPTTLSPEQFIDQLFTRAGIIPSDADRAEAIAEFNSAPTSSDTAARGRALRKVAENSALEKQEFNQAFVLMQYFGYLRRDPDQTPDADYSGYDFWLNKLDGFNGNYGDAEMVKAFLVAGEYRGRFPK